MEIGATDYHTAGEPFRIVETAGFDIPGVTVRARREYAAGPEEVDRVRRLFCHEPGGHADMYGGFLVPPDDDGVFWHKGGYSTACAHGTIALGAWAVESGRVAAPDGGEAEASARTALLAADGALVEGRTWRNDSIVGTTFHARAIGRTPDGLFTAIEAMAFHTGEHRFFLHPRDSLGTGFVLR
jgi:proline racemase